MSGKNIAQGETNFVDKVYRQLLEERIMKNGSFTGEFGKSGLPVDMYRIAEDIPTETEEESRKKHCTVTEEESRKKHCTVTILSMEAVERYKNTKDDQDIKKSLEWLHSNLEEEWFIQKKYLTDANPSKPSKRYSKLIDLRHTAITMWAIAKYEPETFKRDYLGNVYKNFLTHQHKDGSWSESPCILDSDLFSTVLVVKFLNFILNVFENTEVGKIKKGRNTGAYWIYKDKQEETGYIYNFDKDGGKLRFTANVLYHISEMIGEPEFRFLEDAWKYLRDKRIEKGGVVYWKDESGKDSEYISTIHVASALSSVMDSDVELPGIVDKSKKYLIRGFEQEKKKLNAADLAYLLSIFACDSDLTQRLEKVKTHCKNKLSDLHRAEIFKYFTKHGPTHSEKILELLRDLIDYEKLSKYEEFLLDASAWCHDIGMLLRNGESGELEVFNKIRKNHAKRSGEYIREKWEEIGFSNETEADLVAKICEVHQSSGELEKVEEEITYRGDNIRLQFLAALLRFADALDANKERLPDSAYRKKAPKDSQDEYDKHEIVRTVDINRDGNIITLIIEPNSDVGVERRVRDKIQEELNRVRPVLEKEEVKFELYPGPGP